MLVHARRTLRPESWSDKVLLAADEQCKLVTKKSAHWPLLGFWQVLILPALVATPATTCKYLWKSPSLTAC
jgi:hypothetical protein